MLPLGDKLMRYDTIVVNTIVVNREGEVSSCDIPFHDIGRYRLIWFKTLLTVHFQFHHTQTDGAHATRFLSLLQKEIDSLPK